MRSLFAFSSAAAVATLAVTAAAGSLTDIKHIVLFMQENRAFDHVSPALAVPFSRSRGPSFFLLLTCDRAVLWHNGWRARLCRPERARQPGRALHL